MTVAGVPTEARRTSSTPGVEWSACATSMLDTLRPTSSFEARDARGRRYAFRLHAIEVLEDGQVSMSWATGTEPGRLMLAEHRLPAADVERFTGEALARAARERVEVDLADASWVRELRAHLRGDA